MRITRPLTTAAFAAAVVVVTAQSAQAQTYELLTFETDEALGVNDGGVIGSFGATEGANALVFEERAAANATFFDIGTVSGTSGGEALENYNAFAAAVVAAEAGAPVTLNFDFTYDASGVSNPDPEISGEGFMQVGVFINSDAGWNALAWGDLLGGNIGGAGAFPELSTTASDAGVTMTVLDPSDYASGDNVGAVRMSIPVGPDGALTLGTNGDGVFDFAQLGFNMNSGYDGTIDLAFDNVAFVVVPEPTSLGVLGLVGLMLRRRR